MKEKEFRKYTKYKTSGVEWIGEIPEHWELKRTKWVYRESKTRNRDLKYADDDLLSVSEYYGVAKRVEKIDNNDILNRAESLSEYKVVKKGELVINIMLAWKKGLGVSSFEGIVSPSYCVYKLISVNADPNYFHYLYRTDLYAESFRRFSRGIIESRLRLYSEEFFNILTLLPPLTEQTAIANFLDEKTAKIDSLIEKKKKLIELYKEEKTAQINQAVTRGINPNVKLKPSGIDWLGDIPEHWEVKKLKYVARVQSSNVDKKTNEDEKPVLLCNYIDVYKNEFIDHSINFMEATAKEKEIEKFILKQDDVLITKDSETPDDIANPAYVTKDFENVICGYHLAQIRANNKELSGKFLFRLFQSKRFNSHFEVSANGVTRFGLPLDSITDVKITFPSLIEQQQIVEYIESETKRIDDKIARAEKEIELLQEYRTALISEVVTGKIKV